ncbi:Insulin-degrading enzyme-like protein, partial [Leptotrombidium deliense]
IKFRLVRDIPTADLDVQLYYYTSLLLSEKYWSCEDIFKIESQLTYDKFNDAIKLFFSKLHLEIFADGNLTSKEACCMANEIEKTLRANNCLTTMCESQLRRIRVYQLPEQSHHVFEVSSSVKTCNAVYIYFQIGSANLDEKMKLHLLQRILSSHFCNNLHAKEQLGYTVYCGIRSCSGVQGMTFVVHSKQLPEFVEQRIENFINWAQNLSQEEYENYKKGILVKKAEKPKQLIDSSTEMMAEIIRQEYLFDRRNIEISALQKLTKKEVLDFFDEYISINAIKRKKLVVRIVSTESKVVQDCEIESTPHLKNAIRINDIISFHNSLNLYAFPKSFTIYVVISDMEDTFMKELVKVTQNVHLPTPNEFVPSNFELVEREEEFDTTPKLLMNTETCRLWFRQDNIFLLPKASFYIIFRSPFVDVDPLLSTSVAIFTSLLNDSSNEYAKDALVAGLTYKFSFETF